MIVEFDKEYLFDLYKNGGTKRMIANDVEPYEPTHPGEIIKDEIEYRGIMQKELATEMGLSPSVVSEVLNGKRAVTAEYALLFEATLGLPAHVLINLQSNYNLISAKRNSTFAERLKKVRRVAAVL